MTSVLKRKSKHNSNYRANKTSFKPFEVTPKNRRQVKMAASIGFTQLMIADLLGVSEDTIHRHFQEELRAAALEANAKVGNRLLRSALEGNEKSMIFWAKARMGWSDRTIIEHKGDMTVNITPDDVNL